MHNQHFNNIGQSNKLLVTQILECYHSIAELTVADQEVTKIKLIKYKITASVKQYVSEDTHQMTTHQILNNMKCTNTIKHVSFI